MCDLHDHFILHQYKTNVCPDGQCHYHEVCMKYPKPNFKQTQISHATLLQIPTLSVWRETFFVILTASKYNKHCQLNALWALLSSGIAGCTNPLSCLLQKAHRHPPAPSPRAPGRPEALPRLTDYFPFGMFGSHKVNKFCATVQSIRPMTGWMLLMSWVVEYTRRYKISK